MNRKKAKYTLLMGLIIVNTHMHTVTARLPQKIVVGHFAISANVDFDMTQASESSIPFAKNNNGFETKEITINRVASSVVNGDLGGLSHYMDALQRHEIAEQPWESYKVDHAASFAIAYNTDHLFLKYYVKERNLKAAVREVNSDVHKDNCVEFFVSFGEKAYYNLEFNCLGSVKLGYGEGRYGRTMLSEKTINKIKMQLAIAADKGTENDYLHWQLMLVIPKEVFRFSSIDTFVGQKCKVNFYKCGSDLPDPHYLTWNMMQTENPDFHRPEFFGRLFFE